MEEESGKNHIILHREKYDKARDLVLNTNITAAEASKQFGIKKHNLCEYIKELQPDYFNQKYGYIRSTKYSGLNTFTGKNYPISNKSDFDKASFVVQKFEYEGIYFTDNNTSVVCKFCNCYENWTDTASIKRHIMTSRHRRSKDQSVEGMLYFLLIFVYYNM